MDQPESVPVTVRIYDRDYVLRTSGDPARLRELCALVDRRMREVARDTGAADSMKVAMLAALSLAEEWTRAREDMRRMDENLGRRSLECVTILDRFLH